MFHKRPELDLEHPPGQIINQVDTTLSDYIRRVKIRDAFDQVAQEKKLSFGEWWNTYTERYGCPPAIVVAEAAWKAGQENK